MCGIVGELNFKHSLQAEEVYLSMQETLKRRGPDQTGYFSNQEVVLAATRLANSAVEEGRIPRIEIVDGKQVVLVLDGMIYNRESVCDELKAMGCVFTTKSDAEVVLKSYLYYKEDCVQHLNGSFAFVIYDERLNSVFVARDRLGVKPLFYTMNDTSFVFGSEIKALLKHPDVHPVIDTHSLYEIICIGPGRTLGQGVFKGIMEIKPATCAWVKAGQIQAWTYWQCKDQPWIYDFETTKKRVRELVESSIVDQLKTEAPLAALLSGGLDSSIITALAARQLEKEGKKLDTISVEYVGNEEYFKPTFFQPNRDEHYIQIMQEATGSNHHSVILDNADLADALYEAVEARDLPGMVDVDASLYLFCKEIKKVAKVAMTGECADEIFGGYPWYREEKLLNSELFPWSGDIDNRMSYLKPEYRKWDGHQYVLDRVNQTRKEADKLEGNTQNQNKMKEMMKMNLDWFMQTLIDRNDRMSAAAGLEVRCPFCDYRIVEMLYRIPWEIKNWQNREKGLLREAFSDILPNEIAWRKKSPYPKTHNPQYTEKVRGMLKSILDDPSQPLHLYFDETRLRELCNEESQIPWYGQLMTTPQTMAYFVQINYWLSHYQIQFEDCD